MIPNVVLQNAIPDDITGSWYQGKVFVTLKEATFEASSPMRHMAELSAILDSLSCDKKILMIYTDGGPDHRVTYLSVQVTLIAAFMKLDLNFLCAVRTAPCQSWCIPVERIMSTLNLGLQTVGLMRREGSEDFEDDAKKCNSLRDFRAMAGRKPEFSSNISDSLSQPKVLLSQIFPRLKLKDENFVVWNAASTAMIEAMWSLQQEVEPTLSSSDTLRKHTLQSKSHLKAVLDHCCVMRKYMFQIKKCGSRLCGICKFPCLPSDTFFRRSNFFQIQWLRGGALQIFLRGIWICHFRKGLPFSCCISKTQEDTPICFKPQACYKCVYDAPV